MRSLTGPRHPYATERMRSGAAFGRAAFVPDAASGFPDAKPDLPAGQRLVIPR